MSKTCLRRFRSSIEASLIPTKLNDPFEVSTPEICKLAALELQAYILENHMDWKHDFGVSSDSKAIGKGKMFGVLVVLNKKKELGYLSAFSGKLKDDCHPARFVPSLFDLASKDYFLSVGMTALTQMSSEINNLANQVGGRAKEKLEALTIARKEKSIQLQKELFDQYHFLNQERKAKSLNAIFAEANNKKPASGAGECAAPKLLQYAFERDMKPLAIAEFWWGKSSKSEDRQHGEFYPSCNDKCRPILGYMLGEG